MTNAIFLLQGVKVIHRTKELEEQQAKRYLWCEPFWFFFLFSFVHMSLCGYIFFFLGEMVEK